MNEERIMVKDCPLTRLTLNCTQTRCELWDDKINSCCIRSASRALVIITGSLSDFIKAIKNLIDSKCSISNLTGRKPDEEDSKV